MQWVPIGKLGKPHGLKGELKFKPDIMDPDLLDGLEQTRVKVDSATAPQERTIASLRGHPPRLILKFDGIEKIEDAQPLAGQPLSILREDFPPLPEGEFYRFQIEGLQVYDEDGRYFGSVTEIIETGSNDVYVVRDGSKELLLPVIDEVVKTIDLDQGKLIFHAIAGLLEDHPL